MLDEKRNIHAIEIHDSLRGKSVYICFEAPGFGIVACAPYGNFYSTDDGASWKPYPLLNDIAKRNIRAVTFINKDTALLTCTGLGVAVIDFKKQKLLLLYKMKGAFAGAFVNNDEVLCGTSGEWGLHRVRISDGKLLESYDDILNAQHEKILTGIYHMLRAVNGIIYISTVRNGLLTFDPASNTFSNYMHVPMDENSISSNSPRWISVDKNGNLAISSPNGVSLTSINYPMIVMQHYFNTDQGKLVDDEIPDIAEDNKGNLWVASIEYLLRIDPVTRKTKIICDLRNEFSLENAPTPTSIEKDNKGNMWVGYSGEGIFIYSEDGTVTKKLSAELPSKKIRVLKRLANGNIMAGAEDGLFSINTSSFAIDSFQHDPPLKKISGKRIVDISADSNEIWIAASPRGGAYCYDLHTKQLKEYTPNSGFPSDRIYCIEKDLQGNTYLGGFAGLFIIAPDKSIKNHNKGTGLISTRIENMLLDNSGRLWFTNNTNITMYDPVTKNFSYYDDHNGLDMVSYSVNSCLKTRDGKLYFGTKEGLVYFDPPVMKAYYNPLKIFIHYTDDGKNLIPADDGKKMVYAYNEGKINFIVSTSDLMSNKKIQYSYRMTGLDTAWSAPTLNRNILFNLRSGNYTFEVRATYNGSDWVATSIPVSIDVQFPFWQKAWFIITSIALVLLAAYLVYRQRIRQIKNKAATRQQMTELESKALRAQMNPHFIFNSLNAIQELIVTKNVEEGYQYLSQFSKLLRMVLNNSEKNLIPLNAELEMIRLQLSLESLRFKKSFSYHINIENSIEPELINIPPLLLQPYVENAVWHGLRHKEGEKNIWIRIAEINNTLHIEIEDDGVGRQKAEEIREHKLGAGQFESRGSSLSAQRIRILNDLYPVNAAVSVIDLEDNNKQAAGTRIEINLPINLR